MDWDSFRDFWLRMLFLFFLVKKRNKRKAFAGFKIAKKFIEILKFAVLALSSRKLGSVPPSQTVQISLRIYINFSLRYSENAHI